jgi:hypothetical protein
MPTYKYKKKKYKIPQHIYFLFLFLMSFTGTLFFVSLMFWSMGYTGFVSLFSGLSITIEVSTFILFLIALLTLFVLLKMGRKIENI